MCIPSGLPGIISTTTHPIALLWRQMLLNVPLVQGLKFLNDRGNLYIQCSTLSMFSWRTPALPPILRRGFLFVLSFYTCLRFSRCASLIFLRRCFSMPFFTVSSFFFSIKSTSRLKCLISKSNASWRSSGVRNLKMSI